MKKILYLIGAIFVSVGIANAAERSVNAPTRPMNTEKNIRTQTQNTINKSITARTTTTQNNTKKSRVTSRTSGTNIISRTPNATSRNTTNTSKRTQINTTSARSATTPKRTSNTTNISRTASRPARAATSAIGIQSNTFDAQYHACREAYFTCMDQFCGTANDTYRRCICSSKLTEIQSRERALSQTSEQLQDFKDLNLYVIDKSAQEVGAMLSATIGETTQANAKDKSDSAKQLSGISAVLSKTKSESLSTQGTLDIAGDINAVWATTDLTGGTNIANLTGEALYNAVHAQCSEMVAERCPSGEIQNMVTSAYGMYIENDCALMLGALDKQKISANSTIRETEREMQNARLENYNAHNSTSINDCIAQVRKDITGNNACGPDYVHCLDITGRYLNYETGEPIYSANFYQLNYQISLSGDVLTNQTNRMIITRLNNLREFAKRGLDTCRDVAEDVWSEYLRQAITEIYQGQQERIRQVKNECLDVVNACYDEQNQSLKDFSNTDEQLLLGSRLELSEQMCQEKMDTCSNLYGGGTNGMAELLNTMHEITNQKIAQNCLETLKSYVSDLCAVPSNDTLHTYPYACRVYAPGDQKYSNKQCNAKSTQLSSGIGGIDTGEPYMCPEIKKYKSCAKGYFMVFEEAFDPTPKIGNYCESCPANCTCEGDTSAPSGDNCSFTIAASCGDDYIGSLYHMVAKYATQSCVRPSANTEELPATVAQDVNVIMDKVRKDMAAVLSTECERLDGKWYDTEWVDQNNDNTHDFNAQKLNKTFYSETSANTRWGFCAEKTNTTTE